MPVVKPSSERSKAVPVEIVEASKLANLPEVIPPFVPTKENKVSPASVVESIVK